MARKKALKYPETAKAKAAILDRAIKILSKKGSWTKGHYAVNKKGVSCGINDKGAVAFCAMGALDRAAYLLGYQTGSPVETDIQVLGGMEGIGVITLNDCRVGSQDELLSYLVSFRNGLYGVK